MSVDVRTTQGARVHVSHGVFHVNCYRPMDRSHDLQDSPKLHHSSRNVVRTQSDYLLRLQLFSF